MSYYQFNFDLFNSVSMEELRGLLYYNMAVDSYNHQRLEESIQFLVKANALYSSPRIHEFSQVLLLWVQQSDWKDEIKEKSLKAIFSIQQKNAPAIAFLNNF